MKKNDRIKTYAFILITLLSISFISQTVVADEMIDDTFDPASFITLQISNHKAVPSTVDINERSTISFRASWQWPGLTFPNDYKLDLIRDSSNSVLKSWTGTAIKGDGQYRDFAFSLPKSHSSSSGTFSYTIKAYRMSNSQWQLMDTKKVSLTVVDYTPTFSITSFTISPSSIDSGGTTKFSVTTKACYISRSKLLSLRFIDTTESRVLGTIPLVFSNIPKSCKSITKSPNIGANIISLLKSGSHTIKVELRSGLIGSILHSKTATLTIKSPGPNAPTALTIPKSAESYQTISLSAKVTHPSNAKCQIKWDYGDGSSSSWSSLFSTPATTSITTKYTKEGSFTVKAQVKDENGKTSSTTNLGTIVVKTQSVSPMVHLTATPDDIKKGETVQLSWISSNANSITISNANVGYQPVSQGSVTVSPKSTTKYTATVTGSDGKTAKHSVTVTVSSTSLPSEVITLDIDVSKSTINYGESTTLTWQSTNANSVTINNGISTGGATSGHKIISPQLTTTYTATAIGDSGTISDSVTVTVQMLEEDEPTAALSLSTSSITYGGSAILSWSSTNANSVTINNGVETNDKLFGSVSISPPATTTYVMNAIGAGGTVTTTIKLTVNPPTEESKNDEEYGIFSNTLLYIALAAIVFGFIAYYIWREKKKENITPGSKNENKSRFSFLSKYLKRGKKKQNIYYAAPRYDFYEPRHYDMSNYDSIGRGSYNPYIFDEHYRNKIKRNNKKTKYSKNKKKAGRRKK
jgi:hypothetical protein